MKLWLVTDTCYECHGEAVALFDNEDDANSLEARYPWLTANEVETDELLCGDWDWARYRDWFNERADKALQDRQTHDCD